MRILQGAVASRDAQAEAKLQPAEAALRQDAGPFVPGPLRALSHHLGEPDPCPAGSG
jgi:hypothetical protein